MDPRGSSGRVATINLLLVRESKEIKARTVFDDLVCAPDFQQILPTNNSIDQEPNVA